MTGIVFPHQLFKEITFSADKLYLVEEFLFFKQYKFHKQKIAFHRASMKFYENYLKNKGFKVVYVESSDRRSDIRILLESIKDEKQIEYINTTDYWLEKRISETAAKNTITLRKKESPLFLNTSNDNHSFLKTQKRYFQTDYYIYQRKKHNILLDKEQKPIGGKWSYDAENRLKYPKGKKVPNVLFPNINSYYKEAIEYTEQHFANNFGNISGNFIYPTTHEESEDWLQQFLEKRFLEFGEYEDAILQHEHILHHSVLTPMLNVGLLTPKNVIDTTLLFAESRHIPINSLEGFIRQITGWREYIRAVYEREGSQQRTRNFWKFTKKIPNAFYTANTNIKPIDDIINKVNTTAYAHHIERLMILGNFMLLCEIEPDEVYKWFMEFFIDAYDWVMVPNIYGMSQFADGGLMCTKPYISGSNYILKMSDYKKDTTWTTIWDALFWRFMHKQRNFFSQNPRLGMLIATFDKMPYEKQQQHLQTAERYLQQLN
ncbi:MAG: cryptochrome/photolyase family protein [Chitinophagales bacterium]